MVKLFVCVYLITLGIRVFIIQVKVVLSTTFSPVLTPGYSSFALTDAGKPALSATFTVSVMLVTGVARSKLPGDPRFDASVRLSSLYEVWGKMKEILSVYWV